ncbi:MAG: GIY-YIG nuclease family protein [Bryobacteraceae bacterium]
MSSKTGRKEAIKEYKARKIPRGIFVVRCTATGRTWIGSSPNLDAARNGLWFTLELGNHPNKTLQAEWRAAGGKAFEYEILEKLDDDVSPIALNDLLKEKRLRWVERLNAQAL